MDHPDEMMSTGELGSPRTPIPVEEAKLNVLENNVAAIANEVTRLSKLVETLAASPPETNHEVRRLSSLVEGMIRSNQPSPSIPAREPTLELNNRISDARVKADVEKFKGDPKDWLRFWTQLKVFFALQPGTFKSDAQKIGYIYQRLEGDPLKLVTQCYNKNEYEFTVSNLEAFRVMMESLYADQNLLADAGYEFRSYSQTKGNAEHIRKFETLAIAAGKLPAEEMERFIESLKPELQKNLDYESLRFPTLKTDYFDLKQWLIQKEAIGLRKYGSSTSKFVPRQRPPGEPVAMEIGAISSTIVDSLSESDKAGWFSWCKAQNRCFGCGSSDHRTSACPSVSTANKLAVDSYYLCSVNKSSLFLELSLPFGKILALVDTGAQGRLYMARSCIFLHKLRMIPAKSKIRLYSYQKTFVEQVDKTTELLKFEIEDQSFSDQFMICNQLPAPIVIGLDWLSNHDAHIDCRSKKVRFRKGEYESDANAPQKASLNSLSTHSRSNGPKQLAKGAVKSCSKALKRHLQNAVKKFPKNEPDGTIKPSVISSIDVISHEAFLEDYEEAVIRSAIIRVISLSEPKSPTPQVDSNRKLADSLPTWIQDFAHVFDESRCDRLPQYKESLAMDLTLLPDAVAPKGSIYRLSGSEEAALLKEIQTGLKSGKISTSASSGGCPVLFVRKPNGSLRMCVDYRKLNQVTKSQPAILPLIPEILDAAVGSNRYTKIDLKGAFNLLRMRKGTEHLTSFITKYGLFQYNVVPFGLKNAPGHFQLVMDALFSHLYPRGVRCFIDDIIIFENDEIMHRQLVREVLAILDTNGLIASLDKCRFEVESIEFLGHVVSSTGVSMQAGNLQAIQNLSTPRNVKQLQSFLGLVNYYRSFIRNYATLTLPLTRLLKKGTVFEMGKIELEAIDHLKRQFDSSLLLTAPDTSKQFTLQTDASDFAIAGALHQWDGKFKALRPIGFFSRKLTPAEINYPVYDKEFLAIKSSLENWRHLLIDTQIPVKIECDHRNLSYFKETRNLSRRQARYLDFLSDYNIEIVYTPGKDLAVADPLSRETAFQIAEGDLEAVVNNAVLLPAEIFKPDTSLQPANLNSLLCSCLKIETEQDIILAAVEGGDEELYLLNNPQVADPSNWPIFMLHYLVTKEIPSSLPIRFQRLIKKQVKMFVLRRGTLYRKVILPSGPMAVPYIVPSSRQEKLKEIHEVFQHLASPSIIRSLKSRCWWPQMEPDLKKFVDECESCKLNTSRDQQMVAPAHPLEPPGIPFYRWGLDFIQDLPKNNDGFTQIITCMDYATRLVVAKPVHRRDSKTVAEFLFYEIFMKFGAPTEIITDRASCFAASWLQDYLELQHVHHYPSTPYHPNTNGLVERMHAVLGPMITKACGNLTQKWPLFVPSAVFALNSRTHTVTGVSPFYLAYGFNPKLPGDTDPPFVFNLNDRDDAVMYTKLELSKLGQHRAAALWRSQKQADRMVQSTTKLDGVSEDYYAVGSYVKMKNPNRRKFESLWTGPYIIDRLGPNHSYYLITANGSELKNPVNQVHLSPWKSTKELNESNGDAHDHQ